MPAVAWRGSRTRDLPPELQAILHHMIFCFSAKA
jgi:hypothetical protein